MTAEAGALNPTEHSIASQSPTHREHASQLQPFPSMASGRNFQSTESGLWDEGEEGSCKSTFCYT